MLTFENETPPKNYISVLDDQGWVGLVNSMGSEVSIVNAARVSFGKSKSELDEKDIQLIHYLLDNQHTSPLEHVVFTFNVHCPLFVRSQWMRHRTWSFNEISRRYTHSNIQFYLPETLRHQSESNRQASTDEEVTDSVELRNQIELHHHRSLDLYNQLLTKGVCREQARGVLPQNLMTTFWATVDLNNLIKFLHLRDSDHAQREIKEYAKGIKILIRSMVPSVIEYFESKEVGS